MALVTLRTRDVGPLRCEVCGIERTAGLARGVVLDEGPNVGAVWLLWVLPDGGAFRMSPRAQRLLFAPTINRIRSFG